MVSNRIRLPMSDTPKPGVALCIGGAACMQADISKAFELLYPETDLLRAFSEYGPVETFACNNAGYDYPYKLDHWGTLHPDKMPDWKARRYKNKHPFIGIKYWTSNINYKDYGVEFNHVEQWNGSSGLLMVTVALTLGFQKIILAGIPLDRKQAHYDNKALWNDASKYRTGWIKRKPQMLDKVKSFSGWTRDLLGEPTKEWLSK